MKPQIPPGWEVVSSTRLPVGLPVDRVKRGKEFLRRYLPLGLAFTALAFTVVGCFFTGTAQVLFLLSGGVLCLLVIAHQVWIK